MSEEPPVLVLIPGYMLNEKLWGKFEAHLPPHYQVCHASIDGGRTIQEIARHMITSLPERFTLIGFSLGGYLARQLAADFPERVTSLVLVASSLREDRAQQAETKRRSTASMQPTTFKGLSHTAIAKSLHPDNATNPELIAFIQQMGRDLGYDRFVTQSLLPRKEVPAAILSCPTLVIASAEDALRPPEEVKELSEAIPGASFKILSGSGHMLPLEQPQQLAAEITDWVIKN